jgi:ABC-2 type transport system ATP-binding protein
MLVVKNLTTVLGGKKILQNMNFCLRTGEIVALLGPNGAGKTTLMRTLIGFYAPAEGEVSFDDMTIDAHRRDFLNSIAYVPENGGLYPEMTVTEYLTFMAQIRHLSAQEFAENLKTLVQALDLQAVLSKKCEILSKGYKRRVALAGALMSRPKMLILDEPTEGLDPQQKQHLRAFLRRYGEDSIVLVSTHIMEEVSALAPRVLLIKDGRLLCDTTPEDLKRIAPDNNIENSFCAVIGQE